MRYMCTCDAQMIPHDRHPNVCPLPPCHEHEECDMEPCTKEETDD